MLFKRKIAEVHEQIQFNSTEIERLLEKIAKLRSQNQKLEDYLQKLLSAEAAAESSLEQLKTAYLILKGIDSSQMELLKQEADHLYRQVNNNKSSKTSKNRKSQELIDNYEAKAVDVEVVEGNLDDSRYQAVLKLKQLIT